MKTALPPAMFDTAGGRVPKFLVLRSGTRVPLGVALVPSSLDEWLGAEWAVREFGRHPASTCTVAICRQHRTVTYAPTITLRAVPMISRGKTLAAATARELGASLPTPMLYELRISGNIAAHLPTRTESLEEAAACKAKEVLQRQRKKKVANPLV